MLTELQKNTGQAIVNIFETGQATGDYGKITLLEGDPGHLTFGRSQVTLASGNLHLLISRYVHTENASFSVQLESYLDRLDAADLSLDLEIEFHHLLRLAGDDPVMQNVQDDFFDQVYWTPAVRAGQAMGSETALGISVIYDSQIHGSWQRIRNLTTDKHGKLADIGEQNWYSEYVNERRNWLANHSIQILHNTVYRMDSFKSIIEEDKWSLALPLKVRGIELTEQLLNKDRFFRHSAESDDYRILKLKTPYMQGEDIKGLQEALKESGYTISIDGVFGSDTEIAVKEFQTKLGLLVDGIVGPATRTLLNL